MRLHDFTVPALCACHFGCPPPADDTLFHDLRCHSLKGILGAVSCEWGPGKPLQNAFITDPSRATARALAVASRLYHQLSSTARGLGRLLRPTDRAQAAVAALRLVDQVR